MRYFNSNDVREYNSNIKTASVKVLLEEASFSRKPSNHRCDVFLSHSSKDINDLPAVINFLEHFDVKVYVDKDDYELPKKTTAETGQRIKRRIAECKKFIVLVSNNSKDSKWIPWELGIGDEKKRVENIALLPKVDDAQAGWPEQEYMGLYPRIIYGRLEGYSSQVWMVYDHHEETAIKLSEWLKQNN